MTDLVIEQLLVPIDSVRPHPANPRTGDVAAIAESLRTHGQYRTIVVQRSTGYVLAGNHTWKAALSLGWDSVVVGLVDVDDDTALRIMLIDNRLGDLARYDDAQLVNVLSELAMTPEQLVGTGWSIESLTDLANRMAVPDLDALEDRFGAPEEAALWPTVKVRVPPERFSQWRALMDQMPGSDDTARFCALLDLWQPEAAA